MRKILIFSLILSLSSVTWAQKVQVLTGVTPPKKREIAIYPIPSKLDIDDEMLPTSVDYYRFQICIIGQREVVVQPQQQRPPQRGAAKDVPQQSHKMVKYVPDRQCRYYDGTNTDLDKHRMMAAAAREIHVQNGRTMEINILGYLGNPYAMFVIAGKALMPYTVPYNEMPKGSILKKILTDQGKIAKFYSFSLPAANALNRIMQERPYTRVPVSTYLGAQKKLNLPIRISFYEEMLGNGQARTFIVFVFNEAEKYTYPSPNETASDKVYGITPDYAVQYLE